MKAHKISISPKTITRLGATVLPLVIGGGVLVPLTSFAESSAEVSIDLTISSVLTMSLDGIKATENGDGEVGAKIWGLSPGEFSTDQFTEVIARTNAPQGYSITMRGVDAGTGGYADLVGPNDLRMTSSSTVPTSNLDESTWGVRIVAGSEDDANDEADANTDANVEQNSFWQAVPDNSGKRQDLVIDASDKPVGEKITNVYYGIAIGNSQAKGVYTGNVRYTMTAGSILGGTTLTYIRYGTVDGITSVSLDGDKCSTPLSEGGCRKALISGRTYDLEAVADTNRGFTFTSWTQSGEKGVFGDATAYSTTFTPGEEATTIVPTITPGATNLYDITIKTATGIASVSLNGTSCVSAEGCVVAGLTYGETYELTATAATGYTATGWENVNGTGTIVDPNSTTTQFVVGLGASTLTPKATANLYTCTKQYRLEDANGNYPAAYTKAAEEQVAYNSTCTYEQAYENYQTKSTSKLMDSTDGITLSLDLPRNLYQLTVEKDQTTISEAKATTAAVQGADYYRWGQEVAITATALAGHSFQNWAQTSGTTSSFGSANTAATTFTMPTSNVTIKATGNVNTYTITYGTVDGLISVSLGGESCSTLLTDGGCTKDLTYGQSYNLIATAEGGYTFASWSQSGTNGTIGSTTAYSTTFIPGAGTATITPSVTVNTYTITYGTATGISSVSLDGTSCNTAVSAGGCTKVLTFGQTYNLVATVATGYTFSQWTQNGTLGTIGGGVSTNADTTFKVGAGTTTITPNAAMNTYAITYGTVTGISSVSLGGTNCTTALPTGCTKILTYGQSYTLTATVATGYTFSTWTRSAGVGTLASAGSASSASFTVGAGTATLTPSATKLYLQNVSAAECTKNATTTAYDIRDNQEYNIRRLSDGKCWMITNLNLAGNTKIYAETSQVPSGTASSPYYTLPASSTSGFSNDADTIGYVYNSGNKSNTCTGTGCYSYYSWIAATAGSGSSVSSNGGNASYSICPKGWRLPKSGSQSNNGWKVGDLYTLATTYGADLESSHSKSTTTFYDNLGPGTVPNFLLAGYYYNSSFSGGGSGGSYWSSTSVSSANAYNLTFAPGGVKVAEDTSRRNGYAVRCILAE